jgi:hypothetical protein
MGHHTELYEGRPVTICYGPPLIEVLRRSEGVKWCFGCRKRQEFFYVVMAPAEPSYYGSDPSVRCGHCDKRNGDLFPGWYREWEE